MLDGYDFSRRVRLCFGVNDDMGHIAQVLEAGDDVKHRAGGVLRAVDKASVGFVSR